MRPPLVRDAGQVQQVAADEGRVLQRVAGQVEGEAWPLERGLELEGPDLQVDPAAPPAVQQLQQRAVDVIGRLRALLREVTELGVEVKQADGLVDFRSKLHGRTVYLCWKYGEESVTHYHDLEAGFAGRKPLPADADFTGDFLH